MTAASAQRAKADGHVAAGHDQIAMREIHRAGRIDDEDKAKRDKRISCTKGHAVDRELKERHHGGRLRSYFRTSCAPA